MSVDSNAALDRWLTRHAYLKEIARFHQAIRDVLHSVEPVVLPDPQWESHSCDLAVGIPLLRIRPLTDASIDHAVSVLGVLVERLSGPDNPEGVRHDCAVLRDEIRWLPEIATLLMEKTLNNSAQSGGAESPVNSGLIRFLCWKVLENLLRPCVESFALRRAEIPWDRPYCPLCGSPPAMAQLVRTTKGRERFLSCGCCGSRWSYLRTACPFCENQDQDTLRIFELEQEDKFRIDVCSDCNGYIKTYTDEGDEELMLADWSTIHLDVLAKQEGYQRRSMSLYEL